MTDRILRRPDVERLIGLGGSTISEWMARGEFPQTLQLGARAVDWRESDIEALLASRSRREEFGSSRVAAKA